MIKITSLQNEMIKDLVKLKDVKNRNSTSQFIITGNKLIEEANKFGYVKSIITIDEDYEFDGEKIVVTQGIINKISSLKNPGPIIALCNMKKNQITDGVSVLLDNVSDPGNVGTIIRTAISFGIKNVYLYGGCCDIYNEKTLRASMGSIFQANIKRITDLSEVSNKNVVVSILDKEAVNLSDYKFSNNDIVVFGNESKGASQQVIDVANKKVYIKMDNIDSLNVSVAAGIILHKIGCDIHG